METRRLTAKKFAVEATTNVADTLTTPEHVPSSRLEGLVINKRKTDAITWDSFKEGRLHPRENVTVPEFRNGKGQRDARPLHEGAPNPLHRPRVGSYSSTGTETIPTGRW